MKSLKAYLKRIYRLSLSFKKQEDLVWKDLKKLHTESQWRSGVIENEKCIETVFEIAEEKPTTFFYMLYDGQYHCRVKILDSFSSDITTEIFILAAHFNNLLNTGVIVVNVESQYVEYHKKTELIVPLLYRGEISNQLIYHFRISKDMYWAFQRLIVENEAPALIIADLFRNQEEKSKQ